MVKAEFWDSEGRFPVTAVLDLAKATIVEQRAVWLTPSKVSCRGLEWVVLKMPAGPPCRHHIVLFELDLL